MEVIEDDKMSLKKVEPVQKNKEREKERPSYTWKEKQNPVIPSSKTIAYCSFDKDEEDPINCEECGKRFAWVGALFKHMENDHEMPITNDSADTLLYFLAEQNEELNSKLRITNSSL